MDNVNIIKQYTLIQFTQITRRKRSNVILSKRPVWIETCSFKDGPGMKVNKITYTADINKSARFSLVSAQEIAVQFSHLPASLVRADGTVLEAETAALQAEQLKRHTALQQLKRDMAEEFNGMIREAARFAGII